MKREVFARRIAEHLNLAEYFDGIYGSVPGGMLDHKPELLAHVLSEQQLAASDALMVGDRRHDIVGAPILQTTRLRLSPPDAVDHDILAAMHRVLFEDVIGFLQHAAGCGILDKRQADEGRQRKSR
jgi:FMN phosphatase YigB (HAD superfamily)